jgi:hypothetical protein
VLHPATDAGRNPECRADSAISRYSADPFPTREHIAGNGWIATACFVPDCRSESRNAECPGSISAPPLCQNSIPIPLWMVVSFFRTFSCGRVSYLSAKPILRATPFEIGATRLMSALTR